MDWMPHCGGDNSRSGMWDACDAQRSCWVWRGDTSRAAATAEIPFKSDISPFGSQNIHHGHVSPGYERCFQQWGGKLVHPQAGEQRHLFQLNFWIKRKINWEQCWDQVHSRLVYLPVLSGIFHWCGAVSHAGALVVCQGMLLWIPGVSAQIRVTGTASWKRPVPLTSHKIHAFYLVQLVIFTNHMGAVALQRSTQSKMTIESEQKPCVPFLRASETCEQPLCGAL